MWEEQLADPPIDYITSVNGEPIRLSEIKNQISRKSVFQNIGNVFNQQTENVEFESNPQKSRIKNILMLLW